MEKLQVVHHNYTDNSILFLCFCVEKKNSDIMLLYKVTFIILFLYFCNHSSAKTHLNYMLQNSQFHGNPSKVFLWGQ